MREIAEPQSQGARGGNMATCAPMSEGWDQRDERSNGAAPNRALITSSAEERKKPNGKVSKAVLKATISV